LRLIVWQKRKRIAVVAAAVTAMAPSTLIKRAVKGDALFTHRRCGRVHLGPSSQQVLSNQQHVIAERKANFHYPVIMKATTT